MHTQVTIERNAFQQVAWVPSKFAILGKVLEIKKQDGWKVIGVGATLPSEYVFDRSSDYRNTRKASDI